VGRQAEMIMELAGEGDRAVLCEDRATPAI
jgi:hypothetical protein